MKNKMGHINKMLAKYGKIVLLYFAFYASLCFQILSIDLYQNPILLVPELIMTFSSIFIYLFRENLPQGTLIIPMIMYIAVMVQEALGYPVSSSVSIPAYMGSVFSLFFLTAYCISLIRKGLIYKEISYKSGRIISYLMIFFHIMLLVQLIRTQDFPQELLEPFLFKTVARIMIIQGLSIAISPPYYFLNIKVFRTVLVMALSSVAAVICMELVFFLKEGTISRPAACLFTGCMIQLSLAIIRIFVTKIIYENNKKEQYLERRLFVSIVAIRWLKKREAEKAALRKQKIRLEYQLQKAKSEMEKSRLASLIDEVDEDLSNEYVGLEEAVWL